MKKLTGLLLQSALIMTCAAPTQAITRVAPKMNILEFHGGSTSPQGTYHEVLGSTFTVPNDSWGEFDAGNVYDNGFAVGLSYGRMFARHWQATVGFDFLQNKVKKIVQQDDIPYYFSFPEQLTFHSYDINLRLVYGLSDLVNSTLNPYAGLGFTGGMSTMGADGYDSYSDATYALSVEFGLDVKVWHNVEDRNLMTLSSINSYEFAASDKRVRLLHIGLGLKYFFRP